MDAVSQALFSAVVGGGLIKAGKLESELSEDIPQLARDRFGVQRHWHKRIARAGSNTLLGYYDESADRRIDADDIVFLDFGRTYALGSDPHKHRLVADLGVAFRQGKDYFENNPQLTAGELYDFVADLATQRGWECDGAHVAACRAARPPNRWLVGSASPGLIQKSLAMVQRTESGSSGWT
jgi:hypothetical protein